ncbi:unnamed protein product, partial [Oppiella nova]
GLQRQSNRDDTISAETDHSIQYQIENAIQRQLRPIYGARLAISSRTDSGVHAVVNTAHLDLTHPSTDTRYKPSFITQSVNTYLAKNGHEIRHTIEHSIGCQRLQQSVGRQMADLFVSVGSCELASGSKHQMLGLLSPDLGTKQIGPVNADEMLRVVNLFKGKHDFRSKCGFRIRRMIGGIIDVGLNRFKYEHMEWLLNNPSHKNWGFQQTVAPAKDLKLYDDLGNKANEFANSYPNYSEIITHDGSQCSKPLNGLRKDTKRSDPTSK